jgi:acetylornithine/N-succinyldiaminopimelate aminotransferase
MIPALMPNYNRVDLAFERGEGAWLYTADGRRYLDFGSGIATASLGHANRHLADAIALQVYKVMHVSNVYRIPEAERLAQRLVDASFADSVFFCNSGAEACEGMVKLIRRAAHDGGHPERYRMITFEGAFHGRTLGMLAATGNEKYLKGFGPKVDGFDQVPFNNLNAVRDAIGPTTAGIMVEPLQGEGGIRRGHVEFLRGLRAACDEFGLLLGLDEVQCGMGRTGKLFCFEWAGITPDVVATAKGLAGGFPIGAVLAREATAKYLVAGSHGTTFGGNPLACTAANAVLDVILAPGFLDGVVASGKQLAAALKALVADFPELFEETRGMGLIQGLKCVRPAGQMQAAFTAAGLLSITASENVVRLVPPLIVGAAEIAEAAAMMRRAAEGCLATGEKAAAK